MEQCIFIKFCCTINKKIGIKVPKFNSSTNAFMNYMNEGKNMFKLIFHNVISLGDIEGERNYFNVSISAATSTSFNLNNIPKNVINHKPVKLFNQFPFLSIHPYLQPFPEPSRTFDIPFSKDVAKSYIGGIKVFPSSLIKPCR